MKHFSICSSVVLGLFVAACSSSSNGSGGSAGGGNTTGTGATGATGGGGAGGSGAGGAGATGGTSSSCIEGQQQCSGDTPQKCVNGAWQSGAVCPAVCSAGACIGTCKPGAAQCNGNIPQTCDAAGNWVDGAPCALACTNGSCGPGSGSCTPGEKKCKLDVPQTCDASGKWQNGAPCPAGCELGACKEVCKAGEFNCYGNEIQQCDPGPPAKWIPKAGAALCSPTSGTTCDKKTGTCVTPPVVGTTTPTGTYYQYATLNTTAGFQGGYDVDSYDDKIYVNRSSSNLDVYQVTLVDSDGDGKLEPDQHPSNLLSPGPVEKRNLKLLKTYTRLNDKAPLGGASISELFALSDRVFSLGTSAGSKNGGVTEYIFNGLAVNQVFLPAGTGMVTMSHLGFGDNDGAWYGSNEGARRVYSYHAPTKAWVVEFNYPNLAGSHMDGLEVIVSPKTGEQYVYVSDMTSDFLGQYRKDPTGWTQVNLFKYTDGTGQSLEGMGFGAFNHFWATGGTVLYEIGGGDLAQFVE